MKKGFTLIELLAVLVLVGSLFMIVISMITGQIKNQEKDISEAANIMQMSLLEVHLVKVFH